MGDGGCAVLSSRYPLAEFRNSDACHREQIKGSRDWATELASFVGFAPIAERSPLLVSGDDNSCLWPSVAFSEMEPGRSSQVGETTGNDDDDYKLREQDLCRCDKDADGSLPSGDGQNLTTELPACELRKDPEQEVAVSLCHEGSGAGSLTEENGKQSGDVVRTKCRFTSRGDFVREEKDNGIEEWEDATDKGHLQGKRNVDRKTQHRISSRDSHFNEAGGEHASNSSVRQWDKRETIRGSSLTGHSRGGHYPHNREGNEKDTASRSHGREHSTGGLHSSEREAKERKGCESIDHSSYRSSSRVGRRGKENGAASNRCDPASDTHVGKDEVFHRHGERDSHGHRWQYKSHESGSSSGYVDSANHKNLSDRYGGRNSFPDKSGSGSHGRDHHKSCTSTDRDGLQRHRSGAGSDPMRTEDRHHREREHIKDGRDLEIKPAERKASLRNDSAVHYHCPSVTACKDDSRSNETDMVMDLSPAPADDSEGRCSEITWIGAVDPGQDEHSDFAPASSDVEHEGTGWVYIDLDGNTQGPMKLTVLKSLLRDGKLQSDHIIRLDGSNEWVTVEHAGATPAGCPRVVLPPLPESNVLCQPVQPPEAERNDKQPSPANEIEDERQTLDMEMLDPSKSCQIDERVEQLMEGFTLVPGREKEVILEALNNAARRVHIENEQELENEESPQLHGGLAAHWKEDQLISDGHGFESFCLESQVSKEPLAKTGEDSNVCIVGCANGFQSARKWTSRGGDWRLLCQADSTFAKGQVNYDRSVKEKVVLNGGVPLCESRYSGLADPRKGSQQPSPSELSKWRILELPPWAYRFWEFKVDGMETSMNATSRLLSSTPKSQHSVPITNSATPRGGLHSEGPNKSKSFKVNSSSDHKVEIATVGSMGMKLSQTSKVDSGIAPKSMHIAFDGSIEQSEKVNSCEGSSTCLTSCELDCPNFEPARHAVLQEVDEKSVDYVKPVQQLSRKEDLKLEEGHWYYREGAGHEIGPFSYAQLQSEVQRGSLHDGSSVYRKSDDTWVPFFVSPILEDTGLPKLDVSSVSKQVGMDTEEEHTGQGHELSCDFHQIYPQFMGFMCGKLHEYVMKSYKSRDFPATLLEGSERWFSDKQLRSTVETTVAIQPPSTAVTTAVPAGAFALHNQDLSTHCTSALLEPKRDADKYDIKRRESDISDRLSSAVVTSSGFSCVQSCHPPAHVISGSDLDHPKNRCAGKMRRLLDIEDLARGKAYTLDTVVEEKDSFHSKSEKSLMKQDWGTLEPHLLMRVFSYLEVDIKSLVLASATCKSWRTALRKFKSEIKQIDLSSLGSLCSDAIFHTITDHAHKLSRIILKGCTRLSPSAVKTFLEKHRSITTVDANGCDQLNDLVQLFPRIMWVGSEPMARYQHGLAGSHRKLKSLKLIGERKPPFMSRHVEGQDAHSSDDSNYKDRKINIEDAYSDGMMEPMDCDPPDRDSETSQVARSGEVTKRIKLISAGKLIKLGPEKVVHAIADSHPRGKEQMVMYGGKHKEKSMYLVGNSVNDKQTSKTNSSFALERYKKLEREMAYILKQIKIADTNKFFLHQVSDCRSISPSCRRVLPFSEIEERLRGGLYGGNKGGLAAFKDDLFGLCRKLLRSLVEKGKNGKVDQTVFRLTYRLVGELEEKTTPSSRDVSHDKSLKREYHDHQSGSSLVRRKREIGDGFRKQGLAKRRKGLDESSVDDRSEEARRLGNLKRKHEKVWETETSGTDGEDENLLEEEWETETSGTDEDESEPEIDSGSEGEVRGQGGKGGSSEDEGNDQDWSNRIWGARMTKAAMVPPVTRKYELIEEYVVVADAVEVNKRMQVSLPTDYGEKKMGVEFSHLEMPEVREFRPRKRVFDEVMEQEVYGIDPYTHNLLMDSMPGNMPHFSDARRHQLIEEDLLKALNQEARHLTGSGQAPNKYPLEHVLERVVHQAKDYATKSFCLVLVRNMRSRPKDKYVAYRKGLGVVCNRQGGFEKDEFVVEFFGEVYPAWRWFEKQDAIRSLQKKDKDPAPEFYNIFLERPKGDTLGYDLVVVDAMHKANYASRICHSCRPNCEARVTAVNGRYQIGVYTLRPVQYGEELTFDYNSITESKEEHETSICLCGSQGCRGSYLHLAGPETFQEIMKECHGLLHRHHLLLQACRGGHTSKKDWEDLQQAGLGSCLLEGLPDWTIGYAAGVVRFMNTERKCLPKEILKNIVKERRLETPGDSETLEAEIQADGVFNGRLQNLAITLDKVRYVFKKLYVDPKTAPPPLRKLEPTELVSLIWKHENSVVAELLRGMAYHGSKDELLEFKRKVHEHEPSELGNVEKNLRQSLLWLRDELCKAPIACLSRHDAAADLIHMYAYTKLFFTSQDYTPVKSPPLTINPLDLGPKHAHALGSSSSQEWFKTYSKDYVLGQLIFWYKHNVAEPGFSLTKAQRGCLVLPDMMSCYNKSPQQNPRLRYGSKHRKEMFRRMEQQPQKQWPKQEFWEFKSNRGLFGSPMMDAISQGTIVNKEMMDWLKKREIDFKGPWDNQ